jgi:hypothetical protein
MTTGKLKGPVVDQILERFLGGTPLKFSGVQLHIAGRLLTLRIESDDALQKVFEGTADERLEDARTALDKLLAASPTVKQAVEPLQRRYVLIERFSSREICDKIGDDGDIQWKPGYPSDTNLGAGEEERGEIAEAAEKLKTPLAGPMVDSFIKGAPFDYEGARFKIIGDKLNVSIESNDELQKVFEGSAEERLEQAQFACGDFIASSAAIREAVASLDKRYVLTERFSNREICEKNGEDGEVEWMPGYPVDTNVGADDGDEHSLDTADNLMSTREALIVIGNLLLMIVTAAGIGGATYLLGRSFMPELAPLIAVFAVVFFIHSFLVESFTKTIFVFILAAAVTWVAIRYIPVFEVSYSLNYQIAGDITGFLIGLATGKPLAYVYKKIEDR